MKECFDRGHVDLSFDTWVIKIGFKMRVGWEKLGNFNVKNGDSGQWTLGVFNDIVTKFMKLIHSSGNY